MFKKTLQLLLSFFSFLLLVLLLVVVCAVHGDAITLHSAEDLIQLSRDVKSGKLFYKTLVLLDSDIDFGGGLSEQFFPIGSNFNIFIEISMARAT